MISTVSPSTWKRHTLSHLPALLHAASLPSMTFFPALVHIQHSYASFKTHLLNQGFACILQFFFLNKAPNLFTSPLLSHQDICWWKVLTLAQLHGRPNQHTHNLSPFAREWIQNCSVALANQTRKEAFGRLLILASKMGFEEEIFSSLPLDMLYGLEVAATFSLPAWGWSKRWG